jgi:ADP-ribose pyrophosphatase
VLSFELGGFLMQKHELQAWERIATRHLLDHPYCQIVEDTVILPSGEQAAWWRFAAERELVCAICLDQHQRVLIAYQYNNGAQRVVDEFPGGGVEADESLIDAARRELLEETGILAQRLHAIGSFLNNSRYSSGRIHVFLATELEELPQPNNTEEWVAYEWLPIPEVERRIASGALEDNVLLAAWSLFRAAIRPHEEPAEH